MISFSRIRTCTVRFALSIGSLLMLSVFSSCDDNTGTLGVDMMILSKPDSQGFSVHPCVEINLRRTMGHVAIAMAEASPSAPPRVMQITLTDKYRIHIRRL